MPASPASPEERAEARQWAQRYRCARCGATATIGYKYVSVRHSRICPLWKSAPTTPYTRKKATPCPDSSPT